MAFALLDTGKAITLTHKQALAVDKVKRGLVKGSPRQTAFAKHVRKIYFAKQHKEVQREDLPVPDWWHK